MEYTELNDDTKYRMLQSRLEQYERRHFDAQLNLAAAEATGKPGQQITDQIADLETVASLTRKALAGMTPPADVVRPPRVSLPAGPGVDGASA